MSTKSTYNVIDGEVKNVDALSVNTFLVVPEDVGASTSAGQTKINGRTYRIAQFSGVEDPLAEASLTDVYLEEGSLKLVIEPKSSSDIVDDLKSEEPLPGCDTNPSLCDVISDVDGDDDQASSGDEQFAEDAVEIIVEGNSGSSESPSADLDADSNSGLDLPTVFDYGQLARLIASGLAPRNVDAAGRGLFNYNNLLVDTVFERLPLRQLQSDQTSAVEQPSSADDAAINSNASVDPQQSNPSLTAELANREGVRAWFRGFGGDTGPTTTTTLANNFNATAAGTALGVDVSLSSTLQVGVFANYGDVNVYQFSGETGGGNWLSDGWGGGVRADWWTDHFYVQGLVAFSGFEGDQARSIVSIADGLGGRTARGSKDVTSIVSAVRFGAPFQAGNALLEPQFTAAWTQNQEQGFTESGAGSLNLRYGGRTTNFLQTELGLKLSVPINSGDSAQWVPNLRLAWLGDWNQNNESQTIGYSFTNKTIGVASQDIDNNGLLIEGGLDYTMANINSGSWKLYVRGGAEVWGGERGTDWRASGGVTFQF